MNDSIRKDEKWRRMKVQLQLSAKSQEEREQDGWSSASLGRAGRKKEENKGEKGQPSIDCQSSS